VASADLYLTSYQTLHRDGERLATWLQRNGSRIYFVLDEAHYIKQQGGAWADAVMAISKFARHRCVLTGTPFPRVYSDAFNLFDALWPQTSPLSNDDRIRIELCSQRKDTDGATAILDKAIGPLFYRVRKRDLGLAPQVFHPLIQIPMRSYEKMAYDEIVARVKQASKKDRLYDIDLVLRLRRGRMMRLRQSVSYAKLLATAVAEYPEDLLKGELSLTDVLTRYDDLERPAKLDALCSLVSDLRRKGQKIVIWSNFIKTLHLIRAALVELGIKVQLIYGETPTEKTTLSEEVTREKIIHDFTSASGSTEILVANPAACAESISLHKACTNAIYYDLSYNCAQYLQSLDRIHRVGGSEDRPANYYFLQYEDTIDSDILQNVRAKAERMSAVIDREYPIYSLDMFAADEELEAYDRLFA
jgi:SNF2 family DNA or RNA helicase